MSQPLALGQGGEGLGASFQQFAQVEGFGAKFQLTGLDPRQVQHVVEDLSKRLTGTADHRQPLALFGRQGVGLHHLSHAQNAV